MPFFSPFANNCLQINKTKCVFKNDPKDILHLASHKGYHTTKSSKCQGLRGDFKESPEGTSGAFKESPQKLFWGNGKYHNVAVRVKYGNNISLRVLAAKNSPTASMVGEFHQQSFCATALIVIIVSNRPRLICFFRLFGYILSVQK